MAENSYFGLEKENEDDQTYVSADDSEDQLKSEQASDPGPRRLFYGSFHRYLTGKENKNLNTRESISTLSQLSVPDLVRKAELGDLVLDDRGLSRLRERFVSMHKMHKRPFYLCGQNYIIPEQIPSWSEECNKSDLKCRFNKAHGIDRSHGDDTLNRKVALMHGDIISLEVDVIVNSISSNVTGEQKGVSKVITRAATVLVFYELESIQFIQHGEVEATAGYLLPAKYIFHTSGPKPSGNLEELLGNCYKKPSGNLEELLRNCYKNCLDKMVQMGLRTLAFPCISTGAKEVSRKLAANIALTTVKEWLRDNKDSVDKIIFCVYNIGNWAWYQEMMPVIFPPSVDSAYSEAGLLPVEILRMDKNSIELYKRALSEGHEAVHNIRVMVVGHYGVGKTTLTKRLFGEEVDINQRESTNGIDVHVRRCKLSLNTGQWNILDKDQKMEMVYHRLVKVLKRPTSSDTPLEMENNETETDTRQGEDDVDDVDGIISIEDNIKDKNEKNEDIGKHDAEAVMDEKEHIPVSKPLQVETIPMKNYSIIKPSEEMVLHHLKELIEEVQHKSASEDDTNTADVSV